MPSDRILIVDDDPQMVKTLSEVFEKEGLMAIGTTSGEEALEKLSASGGEPGVQVALVDLVMPGMDGIETAARLRPDSKKSRLVLMKRFSAAPMPSTNAIRALLGQ